MNFASYIPENQCRYYRAALENKKKKVYDALLAGYLSQNNRISMGISRISEMTQIDDAVCRDVPELFYIKSIECAYYPVLRRGIVCPKYRFDENTRKNILDQMERKSRTLISKIGGLSDREKAKQIHDYLIRTVTYKDPAAPYSHEAPGTLLYGIGVCEGISKAFKYLADRAGLKAVIIYGETENHVGHAWNLVFIDGCPHHLDVTYDNALSGGNEIKYNYFLCSDSQIRRDHIYDGLPGIQSAFFTHNAASHGSPV